MSIEDELQRLANEREDAFEAALDALDLDPPDRLRRQMRAYLAEQEDHGRIKHFAEKSVRLSQQTDGIQELECHAVRFASGSSLDFNVRMKRQQTGWRITQFKFHLHLPSERHVNMVRIHLNVGRTRDPLAVPRCHLHHRRRQEGTCPLPGHEPALDVAACLRRDGARRRHNGLKPGTVTPALGARATSSNQQFAH